VSNKRKRQAEIKFRADEAEDASIRKAARYAGIPLATFVREVVLAAAKPDAGDTRIEKSAAIALRDILAEINLIAMVTHKRAIHSADADRVQAELRRLQILLFRFYHNDASR
jgi:hypothetical protein